MRSTSRGTMDSTATTRHAVSTSWIGLRCAFVAARIRSGVLPGQARSSTSAAYPTRRVVVALVVALVVLFIVVVLFVCVSCVVSFTED